MEIDLGLQNLPHQYLSNLISSLSYNRPILKNQIIRVINRKNEGGKNYEKSKDVSNSLALMLLFLTIRYSRKLDIKCSEYL